MANRDRLHLTPLRVAIIGSGPSAFYAADSLQRQAAIDVEIDMFERLPTPYGLVRGGVAPDHPKIKSVTRAYERTASDPRLRFFGNVEFGRDLTHVDLIRHYHAIIYAVGAQTDRRLNIPGEDLPGSHAATEFVGWYNGHPDYCDLSFDLTQESAVVVGNGNVAMDVARILARTYDELHVTDIAPHALEALRDSRVKTIYVLGRRGPAQAAFTNPEIKELAELEGADVIVPPDEAALDPLSEAYLREADRSTVRNVEIVSSYASRAPSGKPRQIIMRFLVSPVEILGTERVEAVRIGKNALFQAADGSLRPRLSSETEVIPAGLVFRSIGYHGVALPDVPFDEVMGVIPNAGGRVIEPDGSFRPGEYAVGWIKRGPTGIIGSNKPDAHETIERLLEDASAGRVLRPPHPERVDVEALLAQRHVRVVSFDDWRLIDQIERERGQAIGRERVKFTHVEDMLTALAEYRHELTPG
ncbi:MAG: FAD-dependent oxidoreductase [Chloroflexi bacterium]|nr:FAD-dependent oxidoreductase [Chloroflexota bacterium]